MKIVVTGIDGFAGQHLAKELFEHDVEVVGIGRNGQLSNQPNYKYISTDLTEWWPDNIGEVDAIIHLAGLSAVGPSFDNPQKYIDTNSAMITNMCEFYLYYNKKPRIVVVSSGAVYRSDQTMPLNEKSSVGFNSPYVVSKILLENQIEYYVSRGLDCVIARPFNHVGPGQKTGFLLPDLYDELLKAEAGGTISVGNLKTKRDYSDVRDIVRAYRLLATTTKLSHNIYNICFGKSVAGEEILSKLQKVMGLEDVKVEVDKSRIRPNDAPNIVGDNARLYKDTSWQPEISLSQTLKDFILDK